jgi:predicted RND superfamily exporter protein
VSADHKVAAVALHIREIPPRRMPEMVRALDEYIAAHAPPRGASVRIAGLPYLRSTIVSEMRHDQVILVPLTVLICGILMFLSMRWLPGVILPLVAVAFCAVQVVGGMALGGIAMNVLNNIIPPLLIIVGISDAIHLVERYREEMVRNQGDKKKAIHKAVVSMTVAGLITSLTTSVGLASLGISKTVMLRQFGITAGVGVFYAFIMTMWMLPPVLTFAKAPPQAKEREGNHFVEALIINMTARILRRPWVVLAIAALVIGACAVASQSVKRDHALLDQFRSDDPVYLTTRMLEQQLDGVRPLEVMFTSTQPNRFDDPAVIEAIDAVARWAARKEGVIRTLTHGDMMRQSLALLADDPDVMNQRFANRAETRALFDLMNRGGQNPLRSWVTDDRRSARMQLKLRDVGAHATLALVDELNAELSRRLAPFPDIRVSLTGEAYNSSIGQRNVVEDLGGSMLSAIVIIFVLLTVLFRSVRLGILSIPPNLVPLVGTMAYMVARGIPLNATTVIIFSVSLGLSDHGTIHFMSRFQQETEAGMWTRAAIIRAARGTGFATVEANLSLMAGFGVMLFSSFKPVQQFGELIAVTILLCLLASLFLQPALLMVFGATKPMQARMKAESARIAALQKGGKTASAELDLEGQAS